jgi:glycosyltransferase involved in cell wall biosynthesis
MCQLKSWVIMDQALLTTTCRTDPITKRVAIVHDWLVVYGGAERVLRELLAIYPQADLYAIVDFLGDEDRVELFGKRAKTSFIQKLPFAEKKYRSYLALMPLAIEQFDLSGYDVVISSSHAVAKGVLTGPDQRHICYCYSPIRYAWDMQHQYLDQAGLTRGFKSILARLVLHYIRLWDCRTAAGVDSFVTSSAYIARRIRKVYGRAAAVVPPPVDTNGFSLSLAKEQFYFTVSRLVPYKRVDLIVKAFADMPDRQLVVIGDGPEMQRIRALAGPNVTLLGYQPSALVRDYMQRARAFVFAAEEDFGIVLVEAQACGTPVIAFGRGGALGIVIGIEDASGAQPTGIFFDEQGCGSLVAAVEKFESTMIDPRKCRERAEEFSADAFRNRWLILEATYANTESESTIQSP